MLTYRNFNAWWPDYDHKPDVCYARVVKGLPDMDHAIKLCQHKRVAVQAGGHAGLWPKRLRQHFDHVVTFEPEPVLFECMTRNCDGWQIEMHQLGLARHSGVAAMRPAMSAGGHRIEPDGMMPIRVIALDDMALPICDAIFLDVEGYEVEALSGALETIKRCRPVLHVEELPRAKHAIREFMASNDYELAGRAGFDFVYTHRATAGVGR